MIYTFKEKISVQLTNLEFVTKPKISLLQKET